MTLGFCLAVCSFSEAAASDPYYLNGDKNYPMIQNTGGIYNDGTTGLFLDLSTVTIEDVFEDGLAVRVKLMNLVSNKETGEAWVHVRFDVDGRVWAQRTDGKWSEVSKNFDDPAALAVMFVREEMGDDARRSVLTSQISKIMASKKEALGKTAPSDDAKLPAADGGVKRKGEVVNHLPLTFPKRIRLLQKIPLRDLQRRKAVLERTKSLRKIQMQQRNKTIFPTSR